jgi:Tryptophan halogenase
MSELIRDVVILGGGTAGWMTAAYLSKSFGSQLRIKVIESKNIPRIGVGEATVPNLQRVFFDFLGIPENVWMRECNASFKGAVKFVNWCSETSDSGNKHFYHHFGLIPNCDNVPLSQYWFLRRNRDGNREPMDYACYAQSKLLDSKLAPQQKDESSAFTYAWHFDAQLVAAYLCRLATDWGVVHIIDEMTSVEFNSNGDIAALKTKNTGRHEGDLFIDCSGFRGLLINQALNEPFVDMSNHLFCDSAIASSIQHDDEQFGIEPYTSAIAMKHGWTWKIPMLTRFGSGYVYSSSFVSQDEATSEFLNLWKLKPNTALLHHIKFRTGRNRRAWVRNCVSIGLASCFLEPLESTGIYFIYAAIYQLAKHFPDKSFNPTLRNLFNDEISVMYDDCRDFIQAHYFTTSREDTPFWRANKHELHLSETMRHKIETYKAGLAVNMPVSDEETYYSNFETEFRNYWTNSSYYCIFAGMGYLPDQPMPKLYYKPESVSRAMEMFSSINRRGNVLATHLPTCYEHLKYLHSAGPPS